MDRRLVCATAAFFCDDDIKQHASRTESRRFRESHQGLDLLGWLFRYECRDLEISADFEAGS
jgi:hypothetical protein